MSESAAILLAAGKSTRMQSALPKVMHEICGRPMLSYVLSACRLAGIERFLVVVGHGKELVRRYFAANDDIIWVEQREQHGTGDAVRCCRAELEGFEGSVLVIAGDMPLVRRETLAELLCRRGESGDALTMATTVLEEPTGYGRMIRDETGGLVSVVEHRDCTREQLEIREVNPSYYCFDAQALFESLEFLEPNGAKGEFYLTDTVRVLRELGRSVSAPVTVPADEATGINTRLDLAAVGRMMQDRIQLAIMDDGVTIVDPDNTWIEADVTVGRDTVVAPFSFIGAGAQIGERCRIGPFACVAAGDIVGDGAVVGPAVAAGAPAL